MRIKKEFIVHDTGKKSVLVPTGAAGWSGVMHGNRILGAILALMQEDTTESDVIAAMRGRFDAPEGVIERDVARVISELRGIGALDE